MDKNQFVETPSTRDQAQSAEEYFAQIQKAATPEEVKGRDLTVEEERKLQDGFAVEEMTKSAGWAVVAEILSSMPKSNVDPRGMNREEWVFAQENAFWQGAVAAELIDGLNILVREAHQLQKIKLGEIEETKRMRI